MVPKLRLLLSIFTKAAASVASMVATPVHVVSVVVAYTQGTLTLTHDI